MDARVVSVNVGRLRPVPWRGRLVQTGIFKEPVEGAVLAARVNLAGDDQADRRIHGGPDKAVYAYAGEDYEWWSEELGRPLGPGTFGENFTTAGLDVTGSAIGDRWRIGGALFEVAQPREPCFKLGIRMGDQRFRQHFDKAARPGAYLRILEPGEVRAGDVITVVPAAVPSIRIAELAGELSPELLRRVVGDDRLPDGWRKGAARALDRLDFD